jgi:hypothetical protein
MSMNTHIGKALAIGIFAGHPVMGWLWVGVAFVDLTIKHWKARKG